MEPEARNGAVELRIAVAEDPAVGCIEPVATVVFSRNDANDGPLELDAAGRAVELCGPEAEDAAVRSDEPIAVGGRRRGGCCWNVDESDGCPGELCQGGNGR